ncbi:endonuclease/exonuclease/phosphatase family protein [Galbibacter mesophilus]|uniref:endonuclease/exonuclease/phosphatase family protein n=1 Tax=Galbibacter mesophilus TaxID=379069 RepID=UPI00191FBE46|nr:endonuclease/exonuclease/phosphatase family protein [Galbibacter mesophilus]MCM5662049.1 endonuclease/exonuclease/phosphatase family protein [Galbibacter mesophilus]
MIENKVKISALILLFTNLAVNELICQSKDYLVTSIVFYNVENLYDTKNDTLVFDDDRTPGGKYKWTKERYKSKIERIATTLSNTTTSTTGSSPDIIGLAEIENINVVRDLINHPKLQTLDYGIIHQDSPDERGIDVALIYKKDRFIPNESVFRKLIIYNEEGYRDYTRDQLVVDGYLDSELFCFIVNHWPSRSGGEQRSKPFREAAARLNKKIIDSVTWKNPEIKLISMGDFNDDPTDDSFKKILRTKGNREELENENLYNPMEKLYKIGIGSLAYRDKWSLFDQFFFTENLTRNQTGYQFWKAGVFNADYLKTKTGKYKGYPWRSYAAGAYTAGYSDHFPVYIYLVKEVK